MQVNNSKRMLVVKRKIQRGTWQTKIHGKIRSDSKSITQPLGMKKEVSATLLSENSSATVGE